MNDSTGSHWIASAPGVAQRLDGQRMLFCPAGGAPQVITLDVLHAMDACREFSPFEQQVARIGRALPQLRGRDATIRQTLEQLLARGLFVAADALTGRLSADGAGPVFGPVFGPAPTLVVRACDRPELLARMLESGAEYERRCGRVLRWLVLDDSRTRQGRDGNRSAAQQAAAGGLDVRWLGEDWQRSFVERLIQGGGASTRVAQWLLLGIGAGPATPGRLVNLALLMTAGQGFLLLDDDYRLDAARPPGISNTPRFGDQTPWDVYFPDDAEGAQSIGEPIVDPLQAHIDSCGRPLGAVVGGAHVSAFDGAALAGCEVSQWQGLGAQSRVLATVHGVRGNPRSQSAHWLHHLGDETGSFSRFTGAPVSYPARAQARWLCQTRHQPAFVHACLTTPLTLDNRELLPCTMPGGRAQDRVLTCAMATLYPQHVMLDYPDAWCHQREASRAHGVADGVLNLSLCDLVAACFTQARERLQSADARARLSALAAEMDDLATSPESARLDRFRELISARRATVVTELATRIETFSGPADHPWLADARGLVEANRRALTDGQTLRLRDRDDIQTPAALARHMAEQCGLYARALAEWPALWDYCSESGAAV